MRFIGSKVLLLDEIKSVIDTHCAGAETFCDVFSGTASVARFFKPSYTILSNDLLYFSYCLQKGTIENDRIPLYDALRLHTGIDDPISFFNGMPTEEMEVLPQDRRFFQNHYAPTGGRMYLTDRNALRFDYARNTIEDWKAGGLLDENEYFYLVACAVEGLPFVSNISGTYGAFHKTWDIRTRKRYELFRLEVVTNHRPNRCFQQDGVELLRRISGDILYIDPPYNERQYLPNYHVLETAARYDDPQLNGVTGQRDANEQRSDFCSKKKVVGAFAKLVEQASFRHIILSYNTEGLMSVAEIENVMKSYGIPDTFEILEIPYRRFKSRATKFDERLHELLFYVRKEVP